MLEIRREPFRVLFPLGTLLFWAGVLHWLLLALGVIGEYRSTFHAMTQVQGAMTAYAAGFLLTFIPRRTRGAPPSQGLLLLALAAPCATTVFAWREQWVAAQLCWLALVIGLAGFAVRRFSRAAAGQGLPAPLVWLPVTLASAVAACALAAMGGELHALGRDLVLQGFFSGLVLGVGGVLLPLLTRGEPFPSQRRPLAVAGHLAAALTFFGSFALPGNLGPLLRGLIALGVLMLQARLYRLPTEPGLHRRLAWLAAWCLPLGNLLLAAFPTYRRAELHVVFIGCFALMALAVSLHVAIAHGGELLELTLGVGGARGAGTLLGLMVLALTARVLVDVDPLRFNLWLGTAAAALLAATMAWAWLWLRYRPRHSKLT